MLNQMVYYQDKPYLLLSEFLRDEWVEATDVNGELKTEPVSRLYYILRDESGQEIEVPAQEVKGVIDKPEAKTEEFTKSRT